MLVTKKRTSESGNVVDRPMVFNLILFTVLFAAVIGLFHLFVFSDKMISSSDMINAGVFFRSFYVDYVHQHGSVPVWNPYQFCGIPYIDGFHGDTFYPLSVLKFFFNIYRALGWNLLLHVFLAGITMFACARVFRRSQMAATLAAVGYMFAAYFVSQLGPGHDGKMFVTALFPLTIMLIELAFERRPFFHFSLLGLVIGVIILTPHPQMAYYTLWACAGYVLFRLTFRYVETRSVLPLVKPSGFFMLAVVLGLAISAIHFYSGYTYVKNYSPRADEKRGESWARSWSLHPEEVVSLVVPEFSGVSGETGNSYWGRNNFKDNSEYAGVVPLLLALVAAGMIRSRMTWFLAGLALFAVIYGLAGNTWFFYIFYNLIPNVKSTRAWSMIMFLFSFSVALLAAFGLDFIIEQGRLLKDRPKRLMTILLFALPALVLLGALFFSTSAKAAAGLYTSIFYSGMAPQNGLILDSHLGAIAAGFWKTFLFLALAAGAIWIYLKRQAGVIILWIVIAAALVDAYRFDLQFIRTVDPNRIFSPLPVVTYFKSLPGKFRVFNLAGRYLPTNYLPMFGVEEMTSYHGNQPRWFQKLLGGTEMRNGFNRNLWNMTNTRYLLISPDSPVRGDQLAAAGYREVKALQKLQVFENPQANNRAYMVHQWVVEPDEDKLDGRILSQEFDANRQVGLFADPGIRPSDPTQSVGGDSVMIGRYDNDRITLRTASGADGILVLADNWYPSWKAFVDGAETEVLRANSSFRGVVLRAGRHEVDFRYISAPYRTGKLLTIAGLLFVAGVVGWHIRPRRKTTGHETGK